MGRDEIRRAAVDWWLCAAENAKELVLAAINAISAEARADRAGTHVDTHFATALYRRQMLYREALKEGDHKFALAVEVDRCKLLQLYDAVVASAPLPVTRLNVDVVVALFPRGMRRKVRTLLGA